jgi:RNA polymerase sigma-70 factor (ECF subfamily)
MDKLKNLTRQITDLEAAAVAARKSGDENVAEKHFQGAFDLAIATAKQTAQRAPLQSRLGVLQTAARLALECGEVAAARWLIKEAEGLDPAVARSDDWMKLLDHSLWPDPWLVAAVRRDPPDHEALDTLAARHWKPLFARCQILTLNHDKANDLAQEAWCRILRARHGLKPGGNFPAYLTTIATNLWRDRNRSARRAGPLADGRLLALDAALTGEEDETVLLGDALPDFNNLRFQEQALLALDIDRALEQLTPQLRDVLVSRFLIGESCAEIGRRYGRTEQTISGWVRAAVREMRSYFEQSSAVEPKDTT